LPAVERYRDTPFISLTRGEVDLSAIAGEPPTGEEAPAIDDAALSRLIVRLKAALGDAVRDVRPSKRLRESPVCLVADAGAMDLRLERFLLQHSQIRELSPRVLEINPRHELIRRMADLAARQGEVPEFDELARLLLDQARIVEGEPLPDPGAFLRSMGRFLARALETSMRPTAG
jgi:molecular chaperone HtpG